MTSTCQIYIEDSNPVYAGGDILAGYLEVSTTSDERINVEISFQGHTRNWLSFDSLEEQKHTVPTTDHQFHTETQQLKFDSTYLQFSNGKLTYHFPFEFTVPNQLTSSDSEIPTKLLELPPTIKEGSILHKDGKTYMQPLINYIVSASIFGPRNATTQKAPVICSDETEIVIEPTVRAKPLLESKDSANTMDEYTISCTKDIKRHSWSRPIGDLTITTQEPRPLDISDISTFSDEASTILPLTLAFHPYHGIIPPNQEGPPTWTIETTTSIKSNTFFSTQKFTTPPTTASTSKDLHTGLHSITTKPATHEFIEPEWRTWRECLCLDDGSKVVDISNPCWTTILQIPITTAKTLVKPSYQSIFSATKHELHVKVKVKHALHEAMELVVPLQVVNDSWVLPSSDDVAVAEGVVKVCEQRIETSPLGFLGKNIFHMRTREVAYVMA